MIDYLRNEKSFSPYGILGVIGFLLGMLLLFFICKRRKEKFGDYVYVYVWAALGAIIGAKILYLLLDIKNILSAALMGEEYFMTYLSGVIGGGFVFYGGLFGSIITAYFAAKFFQMNTIKTLNMLTPTMPLAHAFGRMGCHLVGCCYGVEAEYGIKYTHSSFAPNYVTLFPVQITEAFFDIVIVVVLLNDLRKSDLNVRKDIYLMEKYLFMYALIRFCLEFLRGDDIRGSVWLLSTSQWISLIIIIIVSFRKMIWEKISLSKNV